MLLSPEDAEKRLNSPLNLANRFNKESHAQSNITEITIHRPGRIPNIPNLSSDSRNEIALRARLGENQGTLATEFDTTQARVSQLENGKDKSLDEKKIETALNSVRDVAINKLMASLGLLTDDKIAKSTARDISAIAANMSKVVEKTLPRNQEQAGTQVNVILYQPELRKETSFSSQEV